MFKIIGLVIKKFNINVTNIFKINFINVTNFFRFKNTTFINFNNNTTPYNYLIEHSNRRQKWWNRTTHTDELKLYTTKPSWYLKLTNITIYQILLTVQPLLKLNFNHLYLKWASLTIWFQYNKKQVFNFGYLYVKCLAIGFFLDALLTDDEPLWEPIEWSLIQYWLIYIFLFSWIAENLIVSRYGSYTGRDKRVWYAWYKSFWLFEVYYALTMGCAALFVIVPFYHELTYITPLIISWWDWYSRTFFLKFMFIYSWILLLATYLQITMTQFHWKKSLIIIVIINIFLAYLVYVHFFITFFAYFTDANWYAKTRLVDYVQLSHEPNKWSWGTSKRDHFSYHASKTVFWYKNDGPFAGAMLFINIFLFLTLFMVHIFWLTLIRRVYATNELTFTYTSACVSTLRQFLYYFNLIYIFILFSFMITYWRLPVEFYWLNLNISWIDSFYDVITNYFNFILYLFS